MATTEKLVAFRHGLQAALTGASGLNSRNEAVEGTFYLTDDSHRLYVGINDGTAVPVNEGVTTVDSVANLPTVNSGELEAGHFYYAKSENILCVYNGTKWVQINPDTNDNTKNESLTITLTEDTTNNSVSVNVAVKDTDTTVRSDDVIYVGANGVKVTGTGDTVTITGDTYTLSKTVEDSGQPTAKANIQLASTNIAANKSSISLTRSGGMHIAQDTDGNIELSSDDTYVNKLEIDSNTTVPNKYHLVVGNSNGQDRTVNFGATIYYGKDAILGSTTGVGATLQTNDSYVLEVYSKNDIDALLKEKLQKFDAMRFKGTVGQDGTVTELPIPANNVTIEKGDTYKVSSNDYLYTDGTKIDHNNIIADKAKAIVGDVFIANGTEDSTGSLPTVTWVYIPSGDDSNNTTYTFRPLTSSPGGLEISSSDDPTGYIYRHQFSTEDSADDTAGSGLVISTTTGTNNKIGVTKISHLQPSNLIAHNDEISDTVNNTLLSKVDQTKFHSLEISVPSYEYDKFGHLTKRSLKVYKVVDTVPELISSAENTVTNAETTVKLTLTDDAAGQTTMNHGYVKFKSQSLVISADTDAAQHIGIVGIDMYWGSF